MKEAGEGPYLTMFGSAFFAGKYSCRDAFGIDQFIFQLFNGSSGMR